jgi:hypothetical protein
MNLLDAIRRLLPQGRSASGVTVVTAMTAAEYEAGGGDCIASFDRHWPPKARLRVYTEGFRLRPPSRRVAAYRLLDAAPELLAFRNRYAMAAAAGQRLPDGGYDYSQDAIDLARKCFAIAHAAGSCGTRYLLWLDPRCVTREAVPADLPASLLEGGLFSAYRGQPSSDLMVFDLAQPHGGYFDAARALYTSGEVFRLAGLLDREALAVVRTALAAKGTIRARELRAGDARQARLASLLEFPGAGADSATRPAGPRRAFYDFAVSPFSYDFSAFMMCAREHGCDEVVFVPGRRFARDAGGRLAEFQKCTPQEQAQRLANMLLPLAGKAVACDSREQAAALWHRGCFPRGYTVQRPVAGHTLSQSLEVRELHPFEPAAEYLERAAQLGVGAKTVTITIRDTHIKPVRNSDIAAWIEAARWIEAQGLAPLFIPDTENRERSFGGFRALPEASLDVLLRLAVYDRAKLNLGIGIGPLSLCFYSRRPLLIFKMLNNDSYESSAEFLAQNGLPPGSQPWWFTPRQRIVWEAGDDAPAIIAHLARWLAAN